VVGGCDGQLVRTFKYLCYPDGYLFVSKGELDRNREKFTVICRVERIAVGASASTKQGHTFNHTNDVVNSILNTGGNDAFGKRIKLSDAKEECGSDLRGDSSRVEGGALTEVQVVDQNRFFGVLNGGGKRIRFVGGGRFPIRFPIRFG